MARRYTNARELIEWETARIAAQFAGEEDSVWKWAEANVLLQARATSQPGRYDSSWIPYVRAWQDDFNNAHIRRVVIVKGGQMGGTESLLNMVRFAIARDPGPTLWVMPSENLGRSFSETRLQPSLLDCEATREQIPKDPDKFKLLEYQLQDAVLNIVGSNSPASLASRPIRYLFGDELDKWAEATDKEAGALELARVRLATFWNSKEILTSTPTTRTGKIWQEYLLGDQRRYFVPCPLCQHKQALVWTGKDCGVKWPEDERTKSGDSWNLDAVERLAYYQCESCHGKIEQTQKRKMVLEGEWIATNLNAASDIHSYHINALVSPFAKHDWGKLAARFLQAKATLGGLQDFCNSVLAEPWEERIEAADYSHIAQRKGRYQIGEPWPLEKRRFLTADVQADILYWTCRAWGLGGVSRLIEYGRCFDFDNLRKTQLRLGVRDGDVALDSGYRIAEVKAGCASYGWRPTKGWDRSQFAKLMGGGNIELFYKWTNLQCDELAGGNYPHIKVYYKEDGAPVRGVAGLNINVDSLKDSLSAFMTGAGPSWELPQDVGDEYLRHLVAERAVINERTGKREWKRISKANHWLDTEILSLAAAIMCELVASKAKETESE